MTIPTLVFATVSAKARSYWTCDGCLTRAQGSTVRVESTDLNHSPGQMGEAMVRLSSNISNQNMPVGWASYVGSRHLCPKCMDL